MQIYYILLNSIITSLYLCTTRASSIIILAEFEEVPLVIIVDIVQLFNRV